MRFTDIALAAFVAQIAEAGPIDAVKRQLGWSDIASREAGDVTVNTAQTYQTIDGFGFSLAFQRARLITNMADKVKQRQVLDWLFNTTTGAGMTIIRNGIGSSPDSSSDHMNTFAPKNPGGPKAAPQYTWDGKDSGQLWVSQEAVKYGVKTFYGNAWSPPGYMKTNNNENNGGSLCGVPGATCSSGDWRQAYADYLVQYVKYYKAAGVEITHLGPMNEPDFSASYASGQWNGNQAADFIKILSATIAQNNLSSQVGIACCESAGWSNQVNMLNQIKSAGAEGLLKAVTTHTYMSGASGSMNTKVPVWLSEQCDLNGQWTTGWYSNGGAGDGLTWANNIYNALVNNNAGGFVYWEGVQWPNPNTNEKIIRIDENSGAVEVSARLWAFANWSRFVRPGAVRIGSSGGSGIKSAAFKNVDGSIAVVVIASGSGAGTVNVKFGAGFVPTEATGWASDNTRKCAQITVTVTGGVISGAVTSNSITTFHVPAPAAA